MNILHRAEERLFIRIDKKYTDNICTLRKLRVNFFLKICICESQIMKTCNGSKGKGKPQVLKYGSTQQTAGAVDSTSSTRGGGEKNTDRSANGKLPLGQECTITHYLLTPWSRVLL